MVRRVHFALPKQLQITRPWCRGYNPQLFDWRQSFIIINPASWTINVLLGRAPQTKQSCVSIVLLVFHCEQGNMFFSMASLVQWTQSSCVHSYSCGLAQRTTRQSCVCVADLASLVLSQSLVLVLRHGQRTVSVSVLLVLSQSVVLVLRHGQHTVFVSVLLVFSQSVVLVLRHGQQTTFVSVLLVLRG